MTRLERGTPSDERAFFHSPGGSRNGDGAGGLLGDIAGFGTQLASGFLAGRGGARGPKSGAAEKEAARQAKFPGGAGVPLTTQATPRGPLVASTLNLPRGTFTTTQAEERNGDGGCIFPFRRDPRTGECRIFAGERSGPDDVFFSGGRAGEAVMGRFGAGMVPGVRTIDRAVCLRGMQLGLDGLCYDKKQLTNKERLWPAGRRPLLTGGDMRCISIASRAGKKLERTTKRLQAIGLMKKPAPRRAARHEHAVPAAAVSV